MHGSNGNCSSLILGLLPERSEMKLGRPVTSITPAQRPKLRVWVWPDRSIGSARLPVSLMISLQRHVRRARHGRDHSCVPLLGRRRPCVHDQQLMVSSSSVFLFRPPHRRARARVGVGGSLQSAGVTLMHRCGSSVKLCAPRQGTDRNPFFPVILMADVSCRRSQRTTSQLFDRDRTMIIFTRKSLHKKKTVNPYN